MRALFIASVVVVVLLLTTVQLRHGERLPAPNGEFVQAPPPIPERCFQQVGFSGQPPQPTAPIRPIYPRAARAADVSGTVIVGATIDENGRVIRTEVLRRVTLLDAAAVEAVEHTRFAPATLRGQAVCVTITLAVTIPQER